jgi:transposase
VPGLIVDPDELRRLLVDEGRSFSEVARLFGVSQPTVARRPRVLGIEATYTRGRRPELHEGDWLRHQFAAGRSIDDVAGEPGVTYGTVVTARQRLGISTARAPKRPIDGAEVRRRQGRRVDPCDRQDSRSFQLGDQQGGQAGCRSGRRRPACFQVSDHSTPPLIATIGAQRKRATSDVGFGG